MTNKKVINFLNQVRKILLGDKSWLESTIQSINEAFDIAIKALEQSEPCNDDKGCSNCMYSGRPTYKSPCSECRDKSQWEMKPISRSHENGTECEDTISRQKAIDTLDKHLRMTDVPVSYPGIISALTEWLNELPSAQPEPQWISVTERLPEEYGNYLISIHGEDEPDIGTINPNNKRGWSLCDASGFYWASDKSLIVTAWMPFPEPYRVERKPMGKLIDQRASAQSKKFSEVLQDMMDEDYYLFCHTGYSRLAEKDWEWLIEQVKEMEQKRRIDSDGRD